MSSALLENAHCASEGEERNQSDKTVSIKFRTIITRTTVSSGTKSFESNTSKSDANTRVSSRRFTRTHVVGVGNLHAANFTGMDSSSVISAWGLSRPGVDLLATYLDIHRISSANVLDLIPADCDLSQRIGNHDSFIEVSHLGTDKAQVKEECDQKSPARCDHDTFEVFAKETLTNDAKADEVDGTRKEVTTSRTVHLNITHASSLSRKVMR